MRLIDAESAMDGATLFDWYISSVGDGTPVWTEEHIDELLGDFLVIPINTPAMGEWIKCSERLPDSKERCLVFTKSHDVGISRMMGRNLRGEWTCCGYEVTHWMPLPEPPKEVDEDVD